MKASGYAPEKDSFWFGVLFGYHNLTCFCLFTLGLIIFVLSLQEGFYAY